MPRVLPSLECSVWPTATLRFAFSLPCGRHRSAIPPFSSDPPVGRCPCRRLAEMGLISAEPYQGLTLVRPWAGPARLLASVVEELPPWRTTKAGHRVVPAERLGRELIGAVGARADLFALYEKAEAKGRA